MDDFLFEGEVEETADGGDALIIHDVEFGFAKGRGDFVFDNFDLGAAAGDGAIAAFDLADAADVDADAGKEFEGAATRSGFGTAKHDADLFTDLIGEDAAGAGFGDEGGELAHGGAHETGLGTDRAVADFAIQFLFGD